MPKNLSLRILQVRLLHVLLQKGLGPYPDRPLLWFLPCNKPRLSVNVISPLTFWCEGLPPSYPLQRSRRLAIWPDRINPTSVNKRLHAPVSLTDGPSSDTHSVGFQWIKSSHCPLRWWSYEGTWRMSPSLVATSTTWKMSLNPPCPPLPPASVVSILQPTCIGKWWGGGGWVLPRLQTCYRRVIGGGYSYLPP